jgi:4-hydroxy-3-methylbut-2-en-1-yl diphosphate reductase
MEVTIDVNSGFCFGVVFAIQMAEDELNNSGSLYCLGDIVHNNMEVERLEKKGLKIINHEQFKNLHDTKVLIRAHGEPPETYKTAIENNIELIDASCPVVLKLQNRIRNGVENLGDGQIVVYGKEGHAEVNGLVGQTNGKAIIVDNVADLDKLDYSKPIQFFSQTTQPTDGFKVMRDEIQRRVKAAGNGDEIVLESNDTLCRQVSNREPQLKEFAANHDVIIFVSGKKSSNGKVLFDVCHEVNPKSYFISTWEEVDLNWLDNDTKVGICGATSTPMWLMEEIADKLRQLELTA